MDPKQSIRKEIHCSYCFPGGDSVRPYWDKYYQGAQGVIFVVDSTCNEEDMETNKEEFEKAIENEEFIGLPLLVLANHQDKAGARKPEQVRPLFSSHMGLAMGLVVDHMQQVQYDYVVKDIKKFITELASLLCQVKTINPFKPKGFFYHYQMNQSISVLRVVGWYFSFLFKI